MFYGANIIAGSFMRTIGPHEYRDLYFSGRYYKALFYSDRASSCELDLTGSGALCFYTHTWSAIVVIHIGSDRYELDLYSETPGLVEFPVGKAGHVEISISRANSCSRGLECWFLGVRIADFQSTSVQPIILNSKFVYTKAKYGEFITLINDVVIGSNIVGKGVWAEGDIELFSKLINPGDIVLDVGANLGHHSVAFSRMVGTQGRVISFEPQSVVYNLLCANILINSLENVECIKSCVGDSPGVVQLYPVDYSIESNFGALGVNVDQRAASDGERSPINTLDSLVFGLIKPVSRVDFIKIDVQSFELYVLKGAIGVIRAFRPIIFMEISPGWMERAGYDYREVYSFLFELGYTIKHFPFIDAELHTTRDWSGNIAEEWDIVALPT